MLPTLTKPSLRAGVGAGAAGAGAGAAVGGVAAGGAVGGVCAPICCGSKNVAMMKQARSSGRLVMRKPLRVVNLARYYADACPDARLTGDLTPPFLRAVFRPTVHQSSVWPDGDDLSQALAPLALHLL